MPNLSTIKKVALLPALALIMAVGVTVSSTEEANACGNRYQYTCRTYNDGGGYGLSYFVTTDYETGYRSISIGNRGYYYY